MQFTSDAIEIVPNCYTEQKIRLVRRTRERGRHLCGDVVRVIALGSARFADFSTTAICALSVRPYDERVVRTAEPTMNEVANDSHLAE